MMQFDLNLFLVYFDQAAAITEKSLVSLFKIRSVGLEANEEEQAEQREVRRKDNLSKQNKQRTIRKITVCGKWSHWARLNQSPIR